MFDYFLTFVWSSNHTHLIDSPMYMPSVSRDNGYYIASGFTNTMYTLRKMRFDDNGEEVSGYVCKLAIDPATAEARAKEITGCDLKVPGDLNAWGSGGTTTYKGDGSTQILTGAGNGGGNEIIITKPADVVPTTKMLIGKYAGQEIAEIAKTDKKYLEWVYFNVGGNKFKSMEVALADVLEDVILASIAATKAYNDEQDAKLNALLAKESNSKMIAEVGEKVKGEFTYTGYTEYRGGNTHFRFEDAEGNTIVLTGRVDSNFYGRIYILDTLGQKRIKVGVKYAITGSVSSSTTVQGEWADLGNESRYLQLNAAVVAAKTLKAIKE